MQSWSLAAVRPVDDRPSASEGRGRFLPHRALAPLLDCRALPTNDDPALISVERAYRDYGGYVATIALRLMGRDADVDDVVHDVFLAAASHLHQLRDARALKWWLKTTTVRAARQRLRRRKLVSLFKLARGDDDYPEIVAAGATAEDGVLLARIYRLLDEVSADDRLAWTLQYIQGEQLEDVAAICGCSLTTAKRRIAAVRDHLRAALDP